MMICRLLVLSLVLVHVTGDDSRTESEQPERTKQQYIWRRAFSECLQLSMKLAAVVTKDKEIVLTKRTDACLSSSSSSVHQNESSLVEEEKFRWKELADCIRLSKMLATLQPKDEVIIMKIPTDTTFNEKIYTIVKEPKNWYEALHACWKRGQRLATVETEEEQQILINTFKSTGNTGKERIAFWLALADLEQKDRYVWMSTRRPMNYSAWEAGQPDHVVREKGAVDTCVALDWNGFKWWDDVCSKKFYYVCEKEN